MKFSRFLRYKGVKESTIGQNAAYYVFAQADDGSFEAHPVDAQFRFTPVINYRTLTADEAEEEFSLRNKTINYFSLMVKKRLTDTDDKTGSDEEFSTPKVKSKVDKLVRFFIFDYFDFLFFHSRVIQEWNLIRTDENVAHVKFEDLHIL